MATFYPCHGYQFFSTKILFARPHLRNEAVNTATWQHWWRVCAVNLWPGWGWGATTAWHTKENAFASNIFCRYKTLSTQTAFFKFYADTFFHP